MPVYNSASARNIGIIETATARLIHKTSRWQAPIAGPATIAAIDIGSNSIHMVTARLGAGGHFEIVDRAKEMVRLGRGTLTHGSLSAEAMEYGLRTLSTFKQLAERQRAEPILAVATSAVREAANGGEFVLRAWEELGLHIDVITGTEEARLIFEAARHAVDFRGHRPLVVDIGGGSVEVVQGSGPRILWQQSLKLGVARTAERFLHSDPPKASEVAALRDHARRKLAPLFARARRSRPTLMVGTSGTLLNLTAMAAAQRYGKIPALLHNRVLRRSELRELCGLLLARSTEERARMAGLDRRRVDLIAAGAVLAEVLMDGLAMREMRACEWALREGIIVDFLATHPDYADEAEWVPDIRRRSVLRMATRFEVDEPHARHVAALALGLFDASAPIHRLGARERELLEYAALLHDVGLYLSHSKHHRHSHYLITNANLRGFTAEEIQVIATAARFHKGALPKSTSEEVSETAPEVRDRAIKLAAILRLADSFDRSHHGIVKSFDVVRGDQGVELVLQTGGDDAELALWAANRKSDLWRKCFDVPLTIRMAEHSR
jgi:exopolyphosphatase/guanosine-5'-triphosphate,3'-diphosphate pyrophosphatase